VAAKTNLLGSKGGSEAGNVAVPAAVINAILNALSQYEIRDVALPATPERIWRAVHEASKKATVPGTC
jgi:carbon-monoxide dehydrogenase large subunit